MRHVTDTCISMIRMFEGVRLEAYRDPVGLWSIGVGHLGAQPGQRITLAQADSLLRQDLEGAEAWVDRFTRGVATSDGQFSAMVSLCFNIGRGNFQTSSVLRNHLAGDLHAAADAFLLWNKGHVDGRLVALPGLTKRRQTERLMYLGKAVAEPEPPAASEADALNRAELERIAKG